jgi:DNA primase
VPTAAHPPLTELITRCAQHRFRIADWLQDRGISEETAEQFALGFDHEGLSRYTAQRVTVPVFHPWSAMPVGVTARAVFSNTHPKWMHIPFPSQRLLFGRVRRRRLPYLCLVEGPLDAIALEQAGVSAVAAFGVRPLSAWQVGLLLRWSDRFVIWPDNDGQPSAPTKPPAKGRGAAVAWSRRLREAGATAVVAPYPDDPLSTDPDTLVRRQPEFVQQVISSVLKT